MDVLLETWLLTFGLILARVSAFIITIPYLGGRYVPRLVKSGTVLALTCFWFSESQTGTLTAVMRIAQQPWLGMTIATAREVLIGSALGFVFGLFIIPFRVAGEYISQEMGLTMGTISNPLLPESTTVMGDVFETLGVMLFFAHDVHHVFLGALHGSFVRQPIGGAILSIPMALQMYAISSSTEWGIVLIAPIACCLFITSLVLGLLARAAPQLNMMAFGYTIRIIIGLAATLILWPDVVPQMTIVLQRFSSLLIGR